MQDNVFGELEYNNGWTKVLSCDFWNQHLDLKIVVSAYENEKPNEEQQNSYKRLIEDMTQISNISYKKIRNYMEIIKDDILPYCDYESIPEDISKIVSISQLLFLESGSFAILCNSEWDDHGVAVLCTETEMIAGPQDIVWME